MTFKKPVICPLCNGKLDYKLANGTHLWLCKECPFVGFEFYSTQNIDELDDFLSQRSGHSMPYPWGKGRMTNEQLKEFEDSHD